MRRDARASAPCRYTLEHTHTRLSALRIALKRESMRRSQVKRSVSRLVGDHRARVYWARGKKRGGVEWFDGEVIEAAGLYCMMVVNCQRCVVFVRGVVPISD